MVIGKNSSSLSHGSLYHTIRKFSWHGSGLPRAGAPEEKERARRAFQCLLQFSLASHRLSLLPSSIHGRRSLTKEEVNLAPPFEERNFKEIVDIFLKYHNGILLSPKKE